MAEQIDYVRHTQSYLSLRKAIGWIGILLPFVLLIGGLCKEPVVHSSISFYYHTHMRNVFVGSLTAIATFFFFYCGYDEVDNWAGNFAGLMALGTAFFRTLECPESDIYSTLHLVFATLLFLTFAFFSISLFTRSSDNESLWPFSSKVFVNPNRQKVKRNIVYIVCGIVIILCLLASVIIFNVFHCVNVNNSGILFYIETIMLISFGTSWLTKGGSFLFPDKVKKVNPLPAKKSLKRKMKLNQR